MVVLLAREFIYEAPDVDSILESLSLASIVVFRMEVVLIQIC